MKYFLFALMTLGAIIFVSGVVVGNTNLTIIGWVTGFIGVIFHAVLSITGIRIGEFVVKFKKLIDETKK